MADYKKIKDEIEKRGIKQKKIAEILGINHSTLSLKMNGFHSFSEIEVKKIAKFLNVPVENLTGGNSNARANS